MSVCHSCRQHLLVALLLEENKQLLNAAKLASVALDSANLLLGGGQTTIDERSSKDFTIPEYYKKERKALADIIRKVERTRRGK